MCAQTFILLTSESRCAKLVTFMCSSVTSLDSKSLAYHIVHIHVQDKIRIGEFCMNEEEIPESVLKTISDFFLSRIRFLLLFLLLLFMILKT